jgi:hypothetical protein
MVEDDPSELVQGLIADLPVIGFQLEQHVLQLFGRFVEGRKRVII